MSLSKEQIDILCPKHGRSSCDDNVLSNCFYSISDRRLPRCTRCFLLDCLETNSWPDEMEIIPNVQLQFITPKPCELCGCKGGH